DPVAVSWALKSRPRRIGIFIVPKKFGVAEKYCPVCAEFPGAAPSGGGGGAGRPSIKKGITMPPEFSGGRLIAAADTTPGTDRIRSTMRSKVRAGTGLTSHNPRPRYLPKGFIESVCVKRKSKVRTFSGSAPRLFP